MVWPRRRPVELTDACHAVGEAYAFGSRAALRGLRRIVRPVGRFRLARLLDDSAGAASLPSAHVRRVLLEMVARYDGDSPPNGLKTARPANRESRVGRP